MTDRTTQLQELKSFGNASRLRDVNPRYLKFEIKYLSDDNLSKLLSACKNHTKHSNHSNSALMYVLNLSDSYDKHRYCTYSVAGSGPDIDTDFSPRGRDQIIRALQSQYGYDNVARIGTYTPWALKTSVVDLIKILPQLDHKGDPLVDDNGIPIYGSHQDGEALAAKIPDSHRGRYTTYKALQEDPMYAGLIEEYQRIFDLAGPLDGQNKNGSIHACGILISPEPLSNQIPIRKLREEGKDWFNITQWEKDDLEKHGFVKFDMLVIDNLDLNKATCDLIGKPYVWLEEAIPLDDEETYDLINGGYVGGLFQIEQSHVAAIIQNTNPRSINDLSVISALIRPGPGDAGLIADYVEYKKTGLLQNKIHPLLDDVLRPTGGVLIYQEQVMTACRILAGMDLTTADQVRRAMGKKDKDLMEMYHAMFISGAKTTHNIETAEADRIWSYIKTFADYGFNLSHALAYAILTYQNAYLKAHYPTEFMLSLLSLRVDKPDRFKRYIAETKALGITILPPSINGSNLGFTKTGPSEISFGLNAIHGIGSTVTDKLLEAREEGPFEDIFDFFNRVDRSKINTGTIEILAKAGAFDPLGYDRESLIAKLPDMFKFYDDQIQYRETLLRHDTRDDEIQQWQMNFNIWEDLRKAKKVIKTEDGYDPPRPKKPIAIKLKEKPIKPDLSSLLVDRKKVTLQMVLWEGIYCQHFISAHPLDFYEIPEDISYNRIIDIDKVHARTGYLLATILQKKEIKIKKGKNKGKLMATFSLEDQTGTAELVIFTKQYENPTIAALDTGSTIYFPYKVEPESTDAMLRLMARDPIKVIS